VNNTDLRDLKDWFSSYVRSFFSDNRDEQKNIDLKVDHTSHVCACISGIAQDLGLGGTDLLLAEAIGLFHDLGRFPQYAQYKTFRDSISVNHGKLGAEVLEQEGVIEGLPEDEQKVLLEAVRFHNAFSLPSLSDSRSMLFLKLIRDADKLDIWRIFLSYYEGDPGEIPSEAGLGLPDSSACSHEVISCILENRLATLAMLNSVNDFKLMQLSWVYDLNFGPSFALLHKGKFIERITSILPGTPDVLAASAAVSAFARRTIEPGNVRKETAGRRH
jgi:putative nucleotidyltransferase with HDIG domain